MPPFCARVTVTLSTTIHFRCFAKVTVTLLLHCSDQLPAGTVVGRADAMLPAAQRHRAADRINFSWSAALYILKHGGLIRRSFSGHILCGNYRIAERQTHMLGLRHVRRLTRPSRHHLANQRTRNPVP